MNSEQILSAILNNDKDAAQAAFKDIMLSKATSALDNVSIEEDSLDESVSVYHDRYARSHGKNASGRGTWMFTNKPSGSVKNYNDEKEVHHYNGSFSDAKKSAKEWAQKHGHSAAYVMEDSEMSSEEQIDELSKSTLASYIKKGAMDAKFNAFSGGYDEGAEAAKHRNWGAGATKDRLAHKRLDNVNKAVDKLLKKTTD